MVSLTNDQIASNLAGWTDPGVGPSDQERKFDTLRRVCTMMDHPSYKDEEFDELLASFESKFKTMAPSSRGTCFHKALIAVGVPATDKGAVSPSQLAGSLAKQASIITKYKALITVYGLDDARNHIVVVEGTAKSATITVTLTSPGDVGKERTMAVLPFEELLKQNSRWFKHCFYADQETFGQDLEQTGEFADMFPNQPVQPSSGVSTASASRNVSGGRTVGMAPTGAAGGGGAAPIVDDSVMSGSSNVTFGVVRRQKRTIKGMVSFDASATVAKNYRTVPGTMFNNADELFQDSVSRDFAQEIMEDLFDKWGLPTDQPEAMKYAEDLLLLFFITNTASNKSDYQKEFDIPVKPFHRDGTKVTGVTANFKVLSDLLASTYAVSRRQFSRGIADDQHGYLKRPENSHLLTVLATRVGCDPQLAPYAFDGSTHCRGMTTREVTFTKLLESRNLFEDDSVIAVGASDRLMQGVSGGPRSVQPR